MSTMTLTHVWVINDKHNYATYEDFIGDCGKPSYSRAAFTPILDCDELKLQVL